MKETEASIEPQPNAGPDRIKGLQKYLVWSLTPVLVIIVLFLLRGALGESTVSLLLAGPQLVLVTPQVAISHLLNLPVGDTTIVLVSCFYFPMLLLPLGLHWIAGINRSTAVRWQAVAIVAHLFTFLGGAIWMASTIET